MRLWSLHPKYLDSRGLVALWREALLARQVLRGLGVLHRGNFHPYEIKRRLENAMVECYLDVDVGTLYYAIRQLEKEGLISAVSQERRACSPTSRRGGCTMSRIPNVSRRPRRAETEILACTAHLHRRMTLRAYFPLRIRDSQVRDDCSRRERPDRGSR